MFKAATITALVLSVLFGLPIKAQTISHPSIPNNRAMVQGPASLYNPFTELTNCGPQNSFLPLISTQYGELPVAAIQGVWLLTSNPLTLSWTLFYKPGPSTLCLFASGNDLSGTLDFDSDLPHGFIPSSPSSPGQTMPLLPVMP